MARGASFIAIVAAPLMLAACAMTDKLVSQEPQLAKSTSSLSTLQKFPPPERQLYVAVYSFRDQTGQNKPNDKFPEYSRALTQGGTAILMNALKDVGQGQWFVVLERENLDALLQERQIIRANREQYVGENGKPLPPIRGLFNAGLIVGGGIIGFDSNVATGGIGARYLGIGADAQYRRDQVSVYVRATAVQTGEVLVSVVATKTIYSIGISADLFRYVSIDKLLESEAGVTRNEPRELAVKQAVEKAVYALVLEGAEKGYWRFSDQAAQQQLLKSYDQEKEELGLVPVMALGGAGQPENQTAAAPISASPQ